VEQAEETRKPAYPVGAVDNALRLLLLFKDRKRLRVSEAGREIGVASSTAHRLLDTLRYHGFVKQDPESRGYEAGPALIDVGLAAVRDMDVRRWARPHMEALSAAVGETVHLLALRGRDVVFVDSVEGSDPLRVATRTGAVISAYLTAGGRALLAELPQEDFMQRFRGVSKLTGSKTISTLGELRRDLDRIREQGYAVNMGDTEHEPHTAAVAVLIRDAAGKPQASLTVAAPLVRLSGADVGHIVEKLCASAQAIGRELP
jgi:DNA-binding IclR family transcriptional regulator